MQQIDAGKYTHRCGLETEVPGFVMGRVGPCDNSCTLSEQMTPEAAEAYQVEQGEALGGTELIAGFTLCRPAQGIGRVRVAEKAGLPCALAAA